jgi:hypothetical protein
MTPEQAAAAAPGQAAFFEAPPGMVQYIETGRWRGEAVTVKASDWAGVLTTRNVLDCTDPADAWAVPAGILAALVDT